MSHTERPIIWLLGVFVALGLAYSWINPPFEASDELRHFRFVRAIQVNHALPVQGQEACRSQSHHPPLYYLAGALLTAPLRQTTPVCLAPAVNPFWAYRFWDVGVDNKNQYMQPVTLASADRWAVQVLRALNVALGAATVWGTWKIGRILSPQRPRIALAGAAILALNPMFLYLSGAINNDIIAACATTLLVWQVLTLAERPLTARAGVWIGLLYGLALLSKFNTLPMIGIVGLSVTWSAWQRRDGRGWLAFQAALGLTAALVAGWWFVRNQILYGEPTGLRILTELWGVRQPAESWRLALGELNAAWSTLWGRFGFGQIPLPDVVYRGLYGLVGGGLLGWLWLPERHKQRRQRAVAWALAGTALTFLAVLFNYILISPAGAMGRFFFPGLPALALLTAAGWERWIGRWSAPVITAGMGALAVIALLGYLRPAYVPNLRPPAAPLPNPVNLTLDGIGALVGYAVTPTTVQPGQRVTIQLDWQVGATPSADYVLFVHVIDAGGFVTQRDTFPATGRYPTSRWRAGSRWRDQFEVIIPDMAYAPATADVTIGFYAVGGARLLWQTPQGRLDALPIGSLSLTARATNSPAPQFGKLFRLVDYGYDRRTPAPGDTVTVQLTWEVLDAVAADYQIQLLMLDAEGNYRGSADQTPGTATWQAGARITTTHRFDLAALPNPPTSGFQKLRVAIQATTNNKKLPVALPDGSIVGEYLDLAGIEVR